MRAPGRHSAPPEPTTVVSCHYLAVPLKRYLRPLPPICGEPNRRGVLARVGGSLASVYVRRRLADYLPWVVPVAGASEHGAVLARAGPYLVAGGRGGSSPFN